MKYYKVIFTDICFILICYVDIIVSNDTHRNDRCTCQIPVLIHQRSAPVSQPLLLHTGNVPKIVYPKIHNPSAIETKIGESKVSLYCPSGALTVRSVDQCIYLAHLVCRNKTAFQLSNSNRAYTHEVHSPTEVSCTKEPYPSIRQITDKHRVCPMGTCVEIGFQLNDHDFLPTVQYIAVDATLLQPLVACVHIVPVVRSRQPGRNAWTFRRGSLFHNTRVNLGEVFRRDYQRKRFLEIFGDPQVANKYVPEVGDAYLTEGQLVTEKDFFYRAEQSSAYFYENVVPIWRCIAVGNWHLSGKIVRILAEGTQAGLKVWSGVIGVLAMSDYRGGTRRIYLADDGRTHAIPVPRMLFKYVYDAHQHCGLAIITVNDPHLVHGVSRDLILCHERTACSTAYPQLASIERGFTYCCSPDGFARIARAFNLPVFSRACSLM